MYAARVVVCACALLLPGAASFVPPAIRTTMPLAASPCGARIGGAPLMGRKGRPKMPEGMGGRQQYQQQAPTAPTDGVPVFYLYCRSGPGKPWYPVSAMKGDGQSKGLISAWLNTPVGKGVFRDRLDEGMARSIYESERQLASMAVEQYRQLRDYQSRLQWGFKMLDADVMAAEAAGKIEKQKIVPVTRAMAADKGLAEAASGALSGLKLPEMPKELKNVKMPWGGN